MLSLISPIAIGSIPVNGSSRRIKEGVAAKEEMEATMAKIRSNLPKEIGSTRVLKVRDYKTPSEDEIKQAKIEALQKELNELTK